jgi:antitoxin VapB
MMDIRRASLFRNGRSQAVRIPREFEFASTEVLITREGARIVLEPVPAKPSLLDVLRRLPRLPDHEQLPDIPDYPPEPVDL